MELGNLVWFSSQERPFAVRERHCLDLACPCTDAWLTFTEVDLTGTALHAPLTFEIQIDLRSGRERGTPERLGQDRCAGARIPGPVSPVRVSSN